MSRSAIRPANARPADTPHPTRTPRPHHTPRRRHHALPDARPHLKDHPMPARFSDTMKALEAGISRMTPAQAIKNIEAWEAHLEDLEVAGSKTIIADLGRLKRMLQAEPIDGAAVGALMGKLAAATLRIAGRAEGKRASQVEALGQALDGAAGSSKA